MAGTIASRRRSRVKARDWPMDVAVSRLKLYKPGGFGPSPRLTCGVGEHDRADPLTGGAQGDITDMTEALAGRGSPAPENCSRRSRQSDRGYRSILLLGVVEQRGEQLTARLVTFVALARLANHDVLLVEQTRRAAHGAVMSGEISFMARRSVPGPLIASLPLGSAIPKVAGGRQFFWLDACLSIMQVLYGGCRIPSTARARCW